MKRSLMIMIIVVLGLGIFGSLFAGENNTQLPRLGVSRYEVAQPTLSREDLLPPTNLEASVFGNNVQLTWGDPSDLPPPEGGDWITWCNINSLGNGIGTNGAAQFDVAHMYDATDLASYQGDKLYEVKFVPAEANCVYTVKVWTGGNATAPGTLVYSAVHTGFDVGMWNTHTLSTPVDIPTNRLWIGIGINTQTGYPAGCDAGPQVAGKGNMMNFGGWTELTELNEALTYNWSIQAFAGEGAAMKAITFSPIPEAPLAPATGNLGVARFEPNRNTRALLGYKVYRNDEQIAAINDPDATTYQDLEVPNGQYTYGVSAVYHAGESNKATVNVVVDLQLATAFFEEDYESYPDFALTFAPWTLLDQDNSSTYGIQGISFPNSEANMAYIIFKPTGTTPPITSLEPHSGSKMAASFAATSTTNNDWMVTPKVTLGTDSAVKFYARSHTASYGLERFRVGVSTLDVILPQDFQYVSGPTYVEAPTNWTEYIYDLSAYDGQTVYLAIRCVSDDAFVFYVDDFSIHSDGGWVSNEDITAPAFTTKLKGNFPNPFNPETTINYSLKNAGKVSIDIYNQKGQLVRSLVNDTQMAGNHSVVWNGLDNNDRAVASGIYFYKMNAGKYSSTKKMIMMK